MHANCSQKKILVSIVVPVFNEEDAVPRFLAAIDPVLASVRSQIGDGAKTEIVFVDDGSSDRTVEIIRASTSEAVHIRLVRLSRNFGKDAALSAGLAHAAGDAIIPMDADLQDPPDLLPDMIAAWREGAVIVNAVRQDRSSDTWLKRKTATAFYSVFNRLSNYPLHRDVGDFRLLDRKAINAINEVPERVRFMKGLFSWVGFRPVEIPYARPERVAGETKWRMWALWNFALDGITGSSTLPLRIWTYVGGVLAIFSIIYALIVFIRVVIYGVDVPGYASLMVVTLILGASNFIALGIIGEYVGRISIEVRGRPLFIVESVEQLSKEEPE